MISLPAGYGTLVPFTPPRLPGLILWLDAQNLASITKNGSNQVTQWNDLSTSGANATQGTLASSPVYTATGISSRPALTFNGTTQLLDFVSPPAFTNFSVFAVATVSSAVVTRVMIAKRSTTNAVPVMLTLLVNITDQTACSIRDDANTIATATCTPTTTGPFIHIGTNTGGTVNAWRDNANNATGTIVQGTTTAPKMSVGAQYAGTALPTLYFNSNIGEVVLYSRALTTVERTDVYTYLKAKWGL